MIPAAEPSKQEEVTIGRPTSPRGGLDTVGHSGRDNTLRLVECKNYRLARGRAVLKAHAEPSTRSF